MTISYFKIDPQARTLTDLPDGDFAFDGDFVYDPFAAHSFVFKIEQTSGNMPFQLSRFVPETNDWGGSSRQSTMEQAKLRCILDAYVLHLQRSSDVTQWLKTLYNDTAKLSKLEPIL